MTKDTDIFTFRINSELKGKLSDRAHEQRISMSDLARLLIESGLRGDGEKEKIDFMYKGLKYWWETLKTNPNIIKAAKGELEEEEAHQAVE